MAARPRCAPTVLGLLAVLATCGCFAKRAPVLRDGQPRFLARGDGTVEDGRTGLVWAQDANLPGLHDPRGGVTLDEALRFVAEMNAGSRPNMGHTDWRLPEQDELHDFLCAFWRRSTLRELSFLDRALRGYHPRVRNQTEPFIDYRDTGYWSITTVGDPGSEKGLVVDTGTRVFPLEKCGRSGVWPVRGTARRPPEATAE